MTKAKAKSRESKSIFASNAGVVNIGVGSKGCIGICSDWCLLFIYDELEQCLPILQTFARAAQMRPFLGLDIDTIEFYAPDLPYKSILSLGRYLCIMRDELSECLFDCHVEPNLSYRRVKETVKGAWINWRSVLSYDIADIHFETTVRRFHTLLQDPVETIRRFHIYPSARSWMGDSYHITRT